MPKWQTLQVFDELEECYGAGEWARTTDLLITNQLLYQLSYAGKVGTLIVAYGRRGPRKKWSFGRATRRTPEAPNDQAVYLIATLTSASFASISSADVAGRTILSIEVICPVLSM